VINGRFTNTRSGLARTALPFCNGLLALCSSNPDDMAELKLSAGNLMEVFNDNGSTLHALRLSDRPAGQRGC
jgi:hypothetical protein